MAKKTANLKPKTGSLTILYILGGLLAVSSALPAYIQSNFLGEFIEIQTIGYIFMIANLFCVLAIFAFPVFIRKHTNYFATETVLAIYGTSLLGLAAATSAPLAILSMILLVVSSNLIWINMDILIEGFSSNSSTGRTRTIYFTCINAGWIISPLLSSYLIEKGEYTLAFFVAGLLIIPFYLIFRRYSKRLNKPFVYRSEALLSIAGRMWRDPNRRNIFFVALLLQIFYSSAVVYIPFHLLHNLGMDWSVLGIIFSIMLIPFLLIEIPAGIIADRYWGEKELLIVGFLILTLCLFLFFYIDLPTPWLWAFVLFLSRVGAALIEAMRETYFFKIVDAKDIGDINLFRAAAPLGYIIASASAVIITMFLPLNYLFLILSLIMLSGLTFSACLRDTR